MSMKSRSYCLVAAASVLLALMFGSASVVQARCPVETWCCTNCVFFNSCSAASREDGCMEIELDEMIGIDCSLAGGNGCTGQQDCAQTTECELIDVLAEGICDETPTFICDEICCDACSS